MNKYQYLYTRNYLHIVGRWKLLFKCKRFIIYRYQELSVGTDGQAIYDYYKNIGLPHIAFRKPKYRFDVDYSLRRDSWDAYL